LRALFAEEDQERCRLVLCDGCGGRLKVITSLAPLSHPGLILAQFTMLYLDFVDDASIPAKRPDPWPRRSRLNQSDQNCIFLP
jgi:hypothetical protein